MFYSQFILAKKGPLGTIWIAAHLERKLRKNQVADTDIGVSVDSILAPDVPIALRLSSHLLLGVVRIYSRKVNYLFDDCSEALLKVKQAFRSTAVDLPPEESTAPYHSITLPETFDLDDFELPDAENLQGNYDHHVSSRDQITLQDNMDGLNFSTTQFGLDERFGDEDTSGFDLDEELFLSKDTAPEQAEVVEASNPETHPSTQPLTPFDLGKDDEDGHGDTEAMDAGGYDDPMDYSHAPSTPGLVEEPNFSKVQGAVCDDHLDLGDDPKFVNVPDFAAGNDHTHIEDLNMCAAQDDTETIGPNSDLHHVMPNAVTSPLPTDTNSISMFGEPEFQLKPEENRTSNAEQDGVSSNAPTTHSVDGANADREETLENLLDNNVERPSYSHDAPVPEDPSVNTDREETRDFFLGNNVSRPSSSHGAPVPEDPSANTFSVTETVSEKSYFQPASEGLVDLYQDVRRPEASNNVEDSREEELLRPHGALASDIEISGGIYPENPKMQACQEPDDSRDLNVVFGNMHILRRCNYQDQPSSINNGRNDSGSVDLPCEANVPFLANTSEIREVSDAPEASTVIQGEGCYATNVVAPVSQEFQRAEPALHEDIRVGSLFPREFLSENKEASVTSELPAVEKLLSVPEMHAGPQNNMLQFIPANTQFGTAYEGDAGRKRSFVDQHADTQNNMMQFTPANTQFGTAYGGEAGRQRSFVDQHADPQNNMMQLAPANTQFGITYGGDAGRQRSFVDQHADPQNNMMQLAPANTQFGTAYGGDAGRQRSFVDQHADPQNNMMQFTPANTQFGTAYGGDAGRQRSFVDQHADPQNNMMQFTPANTQLGTAYGDDAGRKRSFAETSMTVQSVYTIDSFEAVRSKRAKGSVPDDNDLLSSILVGRRSSVFKVKETPPVKERVRMKRPRATPRPLKRKVLMDDTMVLHGDVIRQQLTNTEAIRRTRKKAPCTRSEIWLLQKALLEDEIFTEPILTGLSAKLAALHTQTYDLSKIRLSLNATRSSVANAAPEDENDPQKATNAVDLSAEPSIDKEIATDGFIESNVVVNDVIAERPNSQESLNHMLESVDKGMATTVLAEPQSLSHEQSTLVAEIHSKDPASELNPPTGPVVELTLATDPAFGDNPDLVANSINPRAPFSQETAFGDNPDVAANSINPQAPFNQESAFGDNPDLAANSIKPQAPFNLETAFGDNPDLVAKSINPQAPFNQETAFGDNPDLAANSINPQAPFNQETNIDSSFHIEELDQPSDQKLEALPVESGIAGDNGSSERKDSDTLRMPEENGVFSGDVGAEETPPKGMENGVPVDFGENVTDAQPSGPVLAESDRPADHLDMTLDQSMQDLFKDELPTNEAEVPTAHGSTEEPNFAVVHPEELGGYEENATMNGDEFPSAWEAGPQDTVDTDVLASGHEDVEDHTELGYELDGHDTGFLNDDDDDIADEDDSYAHSPDQTEVDYSGWSSRTRAVAKYLNVLFDKEPDHGKKILPMDNLLVGKTRKEASRMFFEALVLKTRDYVHVEQENPFDKINIKPGVKMAKFNF